MPALLKVLWAIKKLDTIAGRAHSQSVGWLWVLCCGWCFSCRAPGRLPEPAGLATAPRDDLCYQAPVPGTQLGHLTPQRLVFLRTRIGAQAHVCQSATTPQARHLQPASYCSSPLVSSCPLLPPPPHSSPSWWLCELLQARRLLTQHTREDRHRLMKQLGAMQVMCHAVSTRLLLVCGGGARSTLWWRVVGAEEGAAR